MSFPSLASLLHRTVIETFAVFPSVGILAKARGLAILTVFKAGFLVTARGGSGIVVPSSGMSWITVKVCNNDYDS